MNSLFSQLVCSVVLCCSVALCCVVLRCVVLCCVGDLRCANILLTKDLKVRISGIEKIFFRKEFFFSLSFFLCDSRLWYSDARGSDMHTWFCGDALQCWKSPLSGNCFPLLNLSFSLCSCLCHSADIFCLALTHAITDKGTQWWRKFRSWSNEI